MGHIFGPVPSRRLGLSLGVDIVPLKTCTLSCVYCQVGDTPEPTLERREYVPAGTILGELAGKISDGLEADWITFSGSGEPTLNAGIGDIIAGIRSMTETPVCVITNGTLLWDEHVRNDILDADVVMPSLDSAIDATYRRLCRPHPDLNVERIIDGLRSFRKVFSGKLWLEILFVEGVNDSPKELMALKSALQRISPDSIQLNTVVRPPAELSSRPLTKDRMHEIRDFFGDSAEIIASFERTKSFHRTPEIERIREYLRRRPGRVIDISAALGMTVEETDTLLNNLYDQGEIQRSEFSEGDFWEIKDS
ncbi:radical SAM protein [Candidatus Latescibacterota bacterium]